MLAHYGRGVLATKTPRHKEKLTTENAEGAEKYSHELTRIGTNFLDRITRLPQICFGHKRDPPSLKLRRTGSGTKKRLATEVTENFSFSIFDCRFSIANDQRLNLPRIPAYAGTSFTDTRFRWHKFAQNYFDGNCGFGFYWTGINTDFCQTG